MSVFLNTTRWVFALLANQFVFTLRGASVRPPFASLPNIPHPLRRRHWHADGSVKIIDRIVAAFVFVMMWVLLTLVFILFAIAFYTFGQLLSYRIRLIPSSGRTISRTLAKTFSSDQPPSPTKCSSD